MTCPHPGTRRHCPRRRRGRLRTRATNADRLDGRVDGSTRYTYGRVIEEEESCREIIEMCDGVFRLLGGGNEEAAGQGPEENESPVVEGHGEVLLAAQHSEQAASRRWRRSNVEAGKSR